MTEPVDRLLDGVSWVQLQPPSDTEGLYATHEGWLNIAGLAFRCYTLNDGSRVFDADDIHRHFPALELRTDQARGEPR